MHTYRAESTSKSTVVLRTWKSFGLAVATTHTIALSLAFSVALSVTIGAHSLAAQQPATAPQSASLNASQPSGMSAPAGYGTGFLTTDTTLALPIRELRDDLNKIVGDSATNSAIVGLYVASLKTKELLYARNEHKALVPASNMKLFTTAAALDYLGEQFTFTTSIFLDGIIKSTGEYVGNVIVRGAGDPSMSANFYADPMTILQTWAKALDSLGVRSVLGNIIGDDSYFDDAPLGSGWSWDDIPYPYSAEISALSFNDNKVDISIQSANAIAQPAAVSVAPPNNYVTIANTMMTVRPDSARSLEYDRAMRSNVIELIGAVPLDTTESRPKRNVSVTVDKPTLFMLNLFRRTLHERNIPVHGSLMDAKQYGKKISYSELRPVYHHASPPLREIVRVTNMQSHNLCAEALLRTLGKEIYGKGSAENGVKAVRELFKQRGVALEGSSFADGSGLSRFNWVSAKQIGTMLSAAYNSKYRLPFMQSLASPVEKSTLFGRMKNSLAERALRAKTGTLNAVSSLSGYVITRDQEPVVFSIIFNNFATPQSEIRAIQDAFCMRLASFGRKQ